MDSCCQDKACELEGLRERQAHVLWIVLAINGLMFGVELVFGVLSGSSALLADSLDMLGDTLVYGFSLFALGRSTRWGSSAAVLKGSIMALFGMGVFLEAGYKALYGGAPDAQVMGLTAGVAFVANGVCLYVLTRHRHDDLNMRSTWLCSRNDIIANSGVILAAGSVFVTTSRWPDLLISAIITVVFLRSAWSVLREALAEHRVARARELSASL